MRFSSSYNPAFFAIAAGTSSSAAPVCVPSALSFGATTSSKGLPTRGEGPTSFSTPSSSRLEPSSSSYDVAFDDEELVLSTTYPRTSASPNETALDLRYATYKGASFSAVKTELSTTIYVPCPLTTTCPSLSAARSCRLLRSFSSKSYSAFSSPTALRETRTLGFGAFC